MEDCKEDKTAVILLVPNEKLFQNLIIQPTDGIIVKEIKIAYEFSPFDLKMVSNNV